MEKINFENFKSPGISKEILMQLQDNIEDAIEEQVKIDTLYDNQNGETSGNLTGNIDEYDIIYVLIVNQGTKTENTVLTFLTALGKADASFYRQLYNLRATSGYLCSGVVDISAKTSFSVTMSDPVGWTQGAIRCFKVLGVKF